MRNIPLDISGLQALVTVAKALTAVRFSTHVLPLVDGDGNVYLPGPGVTLKGFQFPGDGGPSNTDITLAAQEGGGLLPFGDAERGVLDDWPINVALIDPSNVDAGVEYVLSGCIGSVATDSSGTATIAANGLLRLAQERPLCRHFQLTCDHDLGDDGCKIPLLADQLVEAFDIGRGQTFVRPDIATGLIAVSDAYGRVRIGGAGTVEDYANVYFACVTDGDTDPTTAPIYDPTPGALTTDGTAVLEARNAWTVYARGQAIDPYHIQLTALPDARAADPSWYVYGGCFIRSGAYSGFPKSIILEWDPDTLIARVALPLSVSDIPADTQFELHPGCDLTAAMCASRFANPDNASGANIENNFAFNFVPPPELAFAG